MIKKFRVLDTYKVLRTNETIPSSVYEEQEKNLRKIFFREISIPSIESLEVYEDYRSWETCSGSKIPTHIKNTFEKTKKIRQQRLPFEDKIKLNESHSFENPDYSVYNHWIEYLDWEIKRDVCKFFCFEMFFTVF